MSEAIRLEPLGDSALLLHFGDTVDTAINARVHAAARTIAARHLPGILDIVPAYASLAVMFDPAQWQDGAETAAVRCAQALQRALAAAVATTVAAPAPVEIPVCYGGEFGPDLDDVAARCGLSVDQVIQRHAAADYQVAMLGFAAGFPYLLGLDHRLQQPRRANPRTRVAAGSVAIGGVQTGIYPRELPGGWNLIGRTPLALFDPVATPPNRLAAGQQVRFRAIDAAAFERLRCRAD